MTRKNFDIIQCIFIVNQKRIGYTQSCTSIGHISKNTIKISLKYSGRHLKYLSIRYLSHAPFLVLPVSSRSETLGCNSIDILDIPKPIANHVWSYENVKTSFSVHTEVVPNLISQPVPHTS